jgi:hypothetical protein
MIFNKTSNGHTALQEKLNKDKKKPKNEPAWSETSKAAGCDGDCSPKKLFGARDVKSSGGSGFSFARSN